MRRSRPQKEFPSGGSSIQRVGGANHRRSSSIDCAIRRGSYLPTARRTLSSEGVKVPGSAVKSARASPKPSICNLFPSQRGSLVDRKHIIKDVRPLSNKDYQKECITALVEYLDATSFPFIIAKKALLNPKVKDFENIFQFLYQRFDANFQVKRIEEDGPKVLKMLGYPFTISKSTFRTINSMSWPQLLGCLMWLIDLCKISDSASLTSSVVDSELEDFEGQNILLSYILQSYNAGIDDPEKEMEIFENLVSRKCDVDFDTEDMKRLIAELQTEINQKVQEKAEYDDIIQYNKTIVKDIDNLKEYNAKMSSHMSHKQKSVGDFDSQLLEKEKQLGELQSLVSEKEKIYKAQGFDGQRAQDYYSLRKNTLLDKLNEKCDDVKNKEDECWDLKIEISEISDKLISLCEDFNLLWENLKGEIVTALDPLRASDVPAAVKLYKENKLALPDLQVTPANATDVKAAMEKVKSHIQSVCQCVQNIISVQSIHNSEVDMNISDLTTKHEVSSALMEQKQKELEIVKSDGEKESVALRSKCEVLQGRLKDIHEEQLKLDHDVVNLEKAIEDLKGKFLEVSSKCVAEGIVAEESHNKTFQLMQETYADINAEREKIRKAMQDLFTLMAENPL